VRLCALRAPLDQSARFLVRLREVSPLDAMVINCPAAGIRFGSSAKARSNVAFDFWKASSSPLEYCESK
jgi:hypothetical protein